MSLYNINMEQNILEQIIADIKVKKPYLIGICGIPGSGKSSFAQKIHRKLPKSLIVPMDGYHLYRKDLDQEGIKYRGAAFTFDLQRFASKIREVKQRKEFPAYFPSFDHAKKDPIQDDIVLNEDIQYVIVEGIYIFDRSIDLEEVWDMKIWIEADIEVAMGRVAKRNFQAGISATLESSWERTNLSDRKNAIYIIENSSKNNCLVFKNS